MFDIDKFIECVQLNPAIWQKECKDYTDREVKERCWFIVAESMFDDWDQKQYNDKQKLVKELKNKWRHVRDSYTKYLNHSNPKRKRYIYADALSFLNHSIRKRRNSENDDVTIKNERDDESTSHDSRFVSNKRKGDDQRVEMSSKKSTSSSFRNIPTDPLQSQFVDKNDSSEEDADRAFLLSVLPDLRKLNDDEKLDFRIHTLQFFRDVRRKNREFPSLPSFQPSNFHSQSEYIQLQPNHEDISKCSPRTATPLSCPVSPSLSHHSDDSMLSD